MAAEIEKRSYARFYYEAPIFVEQSGTGAYYDARMYNFSLLGMYFESDLPLLPGAEVNVWLTTSPELSSPQFAGTVVRWCHEITGAVVFYSYATGIEYRRALHHWEFPKQLHVISGGVQSSRRYPK